MQPIHILMAEDNEGDIMLTKEAFSDSRLLVSLSIVTDGQGAIDFLTDRALHSRSTLPDMVMLDINLPKKNGHEVLRFIKDNETLKHIPVMMLTTSSFETDISLSYRNHANCYIIKPVEVADFLAAIIEIETFWTSIVKLPTYSMPNAK